MDFNGFLKKIAFIRKINRHIIGSLGDLYRPDLLDAFSCCFLLFLGVFVFYRGEVV